MSVRKTFGILSLFQLVVPLPIPLHFKNFTIGKKNFHHCNSLEYVLSPLFFWNWTDFCVFVSQGLRRGFGLIFAGLRLFCCNDSRVITLSIGAGSREVLNLLLGFGCV